jgi:hypothetical protein
MPPSSVLKGNITGKISDSICEMDIRKIHRNFVTQRFPLAVAFLLFIALRIPWLNEGNRLEFWGSMLFQAGIAVFLLYLTQTHGVIRQKTLLPAFFYLLLVGTHPLFFHDLRGSVSAFLVALCLLFLFDTYHRPQSQRQALNMAIFLTVGSFYWNPLFFFFPLFWYGMYRFRSLNLKTFFAGFIGITTVYLCVFAWSVYQSDWTIWVQVVSGWSALLDFRLFSLTVEGWVITAFLVLLFILSGIRIFMAGISEKVQTVNLLSYLYVLTGVLFVFFLIQDQWGKEWLLILCVPLSLLLAYYFTLSSRKGEMWLFLFTIAFFLLMFVWNCITP